jgi:5'-deoxynucleotidase YfbR-like HD superfamily hydrolase
MKKTKCVTIDASLLAEAEEAAARLNVPLSALVEEALRRLLRQAEAWRDVEERLVNIETLLRQCLEEARREPPQTPAETQKPPQQKAINNVWVDILRRR